MICFNYEYGSDKIMDFINDIKKETIIICKSYFKKKILSFNKLIPIKMMTISEFRSKYYFSYNEDTIIYIMDKYNVKYDIACTYIDNLYYIEDKLYNVSKLDFLCELKKDLDAHKLLIYNKYFKDYIKNVDVILYDIRIDSFIEKMLSEINYKIINREYKHYNHKVFEFSTMEDEIEYIAYNICKLIDNGIDINNIKLTNVDSSYYNTIERIFSLFNLKINIPYKSKLVSYPIIKKFIELYSKFDLDYAIENLEYKDDLLYGELIKILNKYIKYNNKDLIIYKLEHSYVYPEEYNNCIEIVNYLDYISNDYDYVFMIGFNDTIIPNSFKDTEYITDNVKKYVYLDDTRILNTWLREDTLKSIYDIKNLTITYKLRDMKHSYYPSTLCSNFEILPGEIENNDCYSEVFNKLKLAKRYDDYIKYGYKSNDFDLLNSNYLIKYNSFSNKYSGISRVMDKLTLSYSKMQIYNKCAFRYYLSEILKLDIYEENFSTVIGSMVHYVMEKCLSNNSMDINKFVKEFLGDREFSKKEKFFLDKYIECIKELLNQVILEKEYSLFNQAMYEEKITIDYGNNVKFVGIIDKILYYIDEDKTYVSLIDYKTGNDDISLKYLEYGLNIQLPIYLYLSTKLNFNNVFYPGFYLQKFNIIDKDYRLVGYSNSDKEILSVIDNNYDNSKVIKGMKTNKDGSFSRYSKVLSNEDIEKISKITEEKIHEVINNIKNNKFDINPKVTDDKDIGCEYCKFRDICFVKNEDKINIQPREFGE